MTMYTVKTHKEEADAIISGNKMFVMRSAQPHLEVGNNISFSVIDAQRILPHPIEERVYRITHVERGYPIHDGIVAIGFRPVE